MEKQPDIRIFIACHKADLCTGKSNFYPVQVGTALTENVWNIWHIEIMRAIIYPGKIRITVN